MKNWLSPAQINRLAAEPAHCTNVDLVVTVDPRRPVVPEHCTQLYYTPIYASLHFEHRLRYNQLFGCRLNEYAMMLEGDLVEKVVRPLLTHAAVQQNPELMSAMRTMLDEEQRHYRAFAALNRACRPDLYAAHDRYFSILSFWTRGMLGFAALLAPTLAFALWQIMAMEESSLSLARDMARNPETETLGPLDESFVFVHVEHMKDEARHLHIDRAMIEALVNSRSALNRRLNAWIFKSLIGGVTAPTRAGSGVKVIRQLVKEMPELADREQEMIDSVIALKHDAAFQKSLFNRKIMPLTFSVFDATDELSGLEKQLAGYRREDA